MKTKKTLLAALAAIALTTAACSNMSHQQQRALSGGAIGAGAGALGGAILGGSAVTGAVVGGAAGAALGAFTNIGH